MNTNLLNHRHIGAAAALVLLTGCAAGGIINSGTPQTAVSGSAGGGTSVDADSSLQRCERTLGTVAVDDGREASWFREFGAATQITTIEPLLRLAVQQSNCFVITSVGNLRSDSRLSRITDTQRNSGEYRAGSNQQKGQRVAADYYLEPNIVINNSATGGVAGALGGMLGGALGGIAGNLKTKASVVTLSLFDIRSAVQIAAAQGSATATNYGAAFAAFGGGAAGGLAGYSNTPEGKATVAAFVDAYNGMVIALKNYRAQEVEGGLGTGGTLGVQGGSTPASRKLGN
jgi:hypothetical protein